MRSRFSIEERPKESDWHNLICLARCTYVEGLLLHDFRTADTKVSLRTAVQKHIAMLGEGSVQSLVPAIQTRVNQAIKFKNLV